MDMLEMWESYFQKVGEHLPWNKERHDALRAAFLAGYMAGSGYQWRAAEEHQIECTKVLKALIEEEKRTDDAAKFSEGKLQ